MKKHSILVPAAVFAALAFSPFAQADLETLLPNGETFAFAKAENLAATKARVDKDAYFAALREKILRPAFDAALAGEDGEEKARALAEFSAWEKRFFETFRGEALVALVDVPAEEGDIGAVFIAEVGESFSQEKAQELLRELCGDAEISDVPAVGGVPAKKCGDSLFAVFGGNFFLASGRAALEKTLAVAAGGNGGFGASPVFAKARERVGASDLWFYVDGATVAEKAYAAAARADAEQAKDFEKNPEKAMFALWAEPVVKAFAPEAFDAVWGGCFYDEDGRLRSESTIAWNADRGAVRLITRTVRDGVSKPAFFPLRDDVQSVSTANFSVGEFVLQLLEIGRRSTPLFAFVDMQIGQLKMTQGTDVPAMLKNFSGGVSSYSLYSETGEKNVAVFDVADRALAEKMLEKAEEFTRRENMDIFVPAAELEALPGVSSALSLRASEDGAEPKGTVAVVGNRVCFGDADTLRLLTETAAAKNPAKSVWDSEAVKSAEALLPEGGCAVSWMHVGRSLYSAHGAAKLQPLAVKTAVGEDFAEALSAVKISPEDFDYAVVSKTYLNGNELTVRSALVPADGNADGE